ncbi:SCO3374 family protein [Streptomyces sp. CRN 30]|uniref:SCO3374 family protein n=1 Tax=Streptomyces sp. CRN 30 TaxID=3075613 RepID=UPI002A80CA6C|nr:SCO3374 family protein [Streptomyces sp. CRN 30]
MTPVAPLPRPAAGRGGGLRRWYEDGLGWATAPGSPVRLVTGLRFDVLDVPAEAGAAALRCLDPRSPVALHGGRMRFLVAAGGADELPGLLEWLEWGGLDLDLAVIGAGGRMEAPPPPVPARRSGPREAAVWLRPPEPGSEVEASLPALSAPGGGGGAADLVRLVDTMANECHRVRLRRACAQPLAFS